MKTILIFIIFNSLSDGGELKKRLERIALKLGAVVEQVSPDC
jgi:hypothetical protein